ncbi:MAG TPA: GntR family transcriptional regulator [Syntrophomonas sp.]|nr:GntR family transcriptional regulator [Syntrophomonas sp.]
MSQLDYDKSKAIYKQIIEDFQKQLIRGTLNPGDKIPSQRDYALKVSVNPNTVQRAYQELERIGLTETIRGQGTFVKADTAMITEIRQEMADDILDRFFAEMNSLGYSKEQITEIVNHRLMEMKGAISND